MNYTVLFIIMSIVFLVAIGIIYTDIMAIREKIETIHRLDMKLIKTLHDSNCTMNQGWKTAIEEWRKALASWENTVDLNGELLEVLKKAIEATERRE